MGVLLGWWGRGLLVGGLLIGIFVGLGGGFIVCVVLGRLYLNLLGCYVELIGWGAGY